MIDGVPEPEAGGDGDDAGHYRDLDGGTLPSEAVVLLMTSITEASISDLDPLEEAIDADALDALFRDDREGPVRVEFAYGDHVVTVTDEYVRARPIDDRPA